MRPTEQIYKNYTAEDFDVWRTLFTRQMDVLAPWVSKAYLDAVETVRFSAAKIPDFKEIDNILKPLTGWGIKVVPNLCPQKEFFEYLSVKKFTATCWLRSMAQLDYLEEPDMFHDVFGHVPLLSDEAYGRFFLALSEIALQHIHDPLAIELLSRVYWFTIEFGLMHENGKLKIYGAGVISSKGEAPHAMTENTSKLNFDVAKMIDTPYRTDILQDKYFVIDSFEQLFHSIPQIRACLEARLGRATGAQ
jgi:phenylalanine-4-hydroxylase